MAHPDYNLLLTLEALLAEGGVARAARRLRLSPSAMSRALARLREATGDPLLVRSGRGLVPTPRALELREKIGGLVQEVEATLRPQAEVDLTTIRKTFTVRAGDGVVESIGPALMARLKTEAPGLQLRFMLKPDKDDAPLRDGLVDLETGVVRETTSPEFRTQALFRDRFVVIVREGHPLAEGALTPARYIAGRHVDVVYHVAPPGTISGPIDRALETIGLRREVAIVVGGFASALTLARGSDLIATVPERHTGSLRAGMRSLPLPFAGPEIRVSMVWHPRLDADPAHRWLRGAIRAACAETLKA